MDSKYNDGYPVSCCKLGGGGIKKLYIPVDVIVYL